MNYPQYYNPYMRSNEIQYVNGIESARAYQLAPNQTALLMDSTDSKFYIKQTDASGFATVKAYVFSEEKAPEPMADYVSRTEFNELKKQMNNISNYLEKTPKNENRGSKREG